MTAPVKLRTARVVVSAVWVVGFGFVAKALGLLKDVVVASKFGTSATMDAFLVAFTIPTLVTLWLRSPVRAGFVPLFTEALEKKGEDGAWEDAGVFLGDFIIVVVALAALAIIFAPWLVSAVAPGFDPGYQALTTDLARIMLLSLLLAAGAGVLSHILHVYGNFALPAAAHPLNNLALIAAAVFFTARFGIRGLAWGVVIGSAGHAVVLWPAVWRLRRNLRLRVDFRHPMFTGVARLALPLIIGMAGAKLDDVIDRIFASGLSEGSISGLVYALRLIELPKEILVVAFSTVLFPLYSRLAARGSYDELGDKLMDSVRIGFFMLLPVSVAMAMLGEPVVRLLFQRGAFDEQSVRFTVSALLLYTPTIWALGLTSIMTAGFMAMKDTKTPVIAGFVRLGLKVALVFTFIGAYAHSGIALATSVSHVFKLVLFFFLIPEVLRGGRYIRVFRAFGGTAVATAVMAAVLFFVGRWVEVEVSGATLAARAGALAAVAGVGVAVYLGASRLVARAELDETLRAIREGVGEIVRGRGRRGGRPGVGGPGGDGPGGDGTAGSEMPGVDMMGGPDDV